MEETRLTEDRQDQQAVQKTQAGDPRGFDDIVRRYGPLLYRLSLQYMGDPEEAEEQAQEILLKAFRNLPQYDRHRRFFPWLYSLALNQLRSELRKRRTRQKHTWSGPVLVEETVSDDTDPAEDLLRNEARRLIRRTLKELPAKYQDVYLLREVEGFSTLDTAEILGIPEGTVKIRLHRGRLLLKQRLEKYFAP